MTSLLARVHLLFKSSIADYGLTKDGRRESFSKQQLEAAYYLFEGAIRNNPGAERELDNIFKKLTKNATSITTSKHKIKSTSIVKHTFKFLELVKTAIVLLYLNVTEGGDPRLAEFLSMCDHPKKGIETQLKSVKVLYRLK
jgi:hypothetical protein